MADLIWRLGLAAALTLPGLAQAAAPQGSTPAPVSGADWAMYNKTYAGQRYSRLKGLTPDRVQYLTEVCRAKLATGGSFQAGPVMVDGTIFVTAELKTTALDARDCSVRWTDVYVPDAPPVYPANRGVAYENGRVFRGTADGRLLALDAATGKLLWKDVVAEPESGEYLGGAPIAWNGLVFIGLTGSDFGARGRIMAYDTATGREAWRFDTIPTGKETGAETWTKRGTAKTGGGGTWTSFSLDPKSEELFVPVGNPSPDLSPADRPGDNLFTNSLVVLDARTGALEWWHQIDASDARDMDLAAAPVLFRDGKQREVAAIAAKDGYLRVIDRESHAELFHTAITTVDDKVGAPTTAGAHMCPGAMGGTEWNGAAFDPERKLLFAPAVDWCAVYISKSAPYVAGKMNFGGTFHLDPGGGTGWINAVDSDTGAMKWRYHAPSPVVAAITPTAGGVVLAGDVTGHLLLLDAGTGAVLRTIDAGGSLAGGIITYALDGKQYVAFDAGNVSRTAYGALGDPSLVIMRVDVPAEIAAGDAVDTRGAALFTQRCTACHGGNGTGVPGHSLQGLADRMSVEQIIAKIENPTPPMPQLYPSVLNVDDVKVLAMYLHDGIRQ